MSYKKLRAPVAPEQSGVIPYRIRDGRIEILLITTRKQRKWIVPKGWIEEEMSTPASAAKEALEEAGVRGNVASASLGCYRHGGSDDDPVVEVFLMRVEKELPSWPEDEERERRWVGLDEAYGEVDEEGLKSILDEAAAIMGLGLDGADRSDRENIHAAIPDESRAAH